MEKNKRQYRYYSACNKRALSILKELTGSMRHAMVLDQIAFCSINSTYILPKETEQTGWCCVMYKSLAEEFDYHENTICTLIKKFVHLGLIEKVVKKLKGDTRACIRLTHKTLNALNITPVYKEKACLEIKQKSDSKTNEKMIAYNEVKDQNLTDIDNITFCEKENVENIDKPITPIKAIPDEYQNICVKVGERLIEPQKHYIISVIERLKKQHSLIFSGSSSRLFAEIAFSVLNIEHFETAKGFRHRVNIIAKLLRTKQWKTPKGFFKYWDVGQEMKMRNEEKTKIHTYQKFDEANRVGHSDVLFDTNTKPEWQLSREEQKLKKELGEVNQKLFETASELKALYQFVKNKPELTEAICKLNDKEKELKGRSEILTHKLLTATALVEYEFCQRKHCEPLYETYA